MRACQLQLEESSRKMRRQIQTHFPARSSHLKPGPPIPQTPGAQAQGTPPPPAAPWACPPPPAVTDRPGSTGPGGGGIRGRVPPCCALHGNTEQPAGAQSPTECTGPAPGPPAPPHPGALRGGRGQPGGTWLGSCCVRFSPEPKASSTCRGTPVGWCFWLFQLL